MVKTSSMGDIIHSLPALSDAMRAIPDIRFDWVVEEGFAEIPAWHPAVDRVIPIALRRWRKSPWRAYRSGEYGAYRSALRARRYDAVIDAQGLLKSAVLAVRPARGPSYGLDRRSVKEPLAARFYDHRLAVAKGQHAVERVRQIFALALGYAVPDGAGDFLIRDRFSPRDGPPYLVFLHGTTRHEKHWPEAYWQQLVEMAGKVGWRVKLPWGNSGEEARARRLAEASDLAEMLPRLGLNELAQELAGAVAMVSVDTGLSHLAAALQRPNVTLFGPTDPGLVGGYGPNQLCLRAGDFPAVSANTDPPGFAPLTPGLVWERLLALIEEAGLNHGTE